jgi:hypothetical protein
MTIPIGYNSTNFTNGTIYPSPNPSSSSVDLFWLWVSLPIIVVVAIAMVIVIWVNYNYEKHYANSKKYIKTVTNTEVRSCCLCKSLIQRGPCKQTSCGCTFCNSNCIENRLTQFLLNERTVTCPKCNAQLITIDRMVVVNNDDQDISLDSISTD